MRISALYLALVNALGVTEAEDKTLIATYGDTTVPVIVPILRAKEKVELPMVIPTQEVLDMEEDGSLIKFHPLAESPFAGQSEVLNKLIVLTSAKVCASIVGLVTNLIEISVNYEDSDNITNKAMRIIKPMPSITKAKTREKVLDYTRKVLRAHGGIAGKNMILRISTGRRSRSDITAIRWAELSMPVLKRQDENKIFGVKAPSKAAYDTVMAAFEIALGVSGETKGYLNGTRSHTAPYFQAYAKTFIEIAEHINATIDDLGKKGNKDLKIDLSWTELLTDIDTLATELTVNFEGNTGTATGKSEDIAVTTERLAPEPIKVAPPTPAATEEVDDDCPFDMDEPSKPEPVQNRRPSAPVQTTGNTNMSQQRRPSFLPKIKVAGNNNVQQEAMSQEVAEPVKKSRLEVGTRSAPVQPRSGKIETGTRVKLVKVYDSAGQLVELANGAPLIVEEADVPTGIFIIGLDLDGNIAYQTDAHDAIPHLDSVTKAEADRRRRENELEAKRNPHGNQRADDRHYPRDGRSQGGAQMGYREDRGHGQRPSDPYSRQQPQDGRYRNDHRQQPSRMGYRDDRQPQSNYQPQGQRYNQRYR